MCIRGRGNPIHNDMLYAARVAGLDFIVNVVDVYKRQGDTITSIKSGLMGPLAGIGDTIDGGVVTPLLLTLFIGITNTGTVSYTHLTLSVSETSHIYNVLAATHLGNFLMQKELPEEESNIRASVFVA